MAATSAKPLSNRSSTGVFNYLAASVQPSLYRNGEVLTRRDADGSDAGTEGVLLEERTMVVEDARSLEGSHGRTLAANGFELLRRPLGDPGLDFFDHRQVVRSYYDECARIVRDATGAAQVFAFDHNIRSAVGKKGKRRITGGQQVQGPAHLVHGDYTLTSAVQRLRELTSPPSGNDTLRGVLGDGQSLIACESADRAIAEDGRFAIINVWRSIADEPVATDPLGLCDAQSVRPQDLVVFEIHYQDRIGENYFARFSPGHRWYYYPDMTRDEVLLIKQWDSAGELATTRGVRPDSTGGDTRSTFSFHSAFEDPAAGPDAPARWSIEVRCIVIHG